MKKFFEWPLTVQVTFGLIILSITCMVSGDSFDRREHFIAKKTGKYFRMLPLRSSAIIGLGFLLISCIVTYGASEAGHCPTMTAVKNAQNRLAGIIAACLFWIMSVWYFYCI